MKYTLFLVFILSSLDSKGNAFQDTLKTYRLGEIISSSTADISPSHVAEHKISHYAIDKLSADNLSEIESVIPSANIITNSRGESLLYLRGASDRQLGLFLNGAPLNIGWDNRMDLSLIPTSIIGSVNVSGAGGSILYGPNSMGGVMNILTREKEEENLGGQIKVSAKEANGYSTDASLGGKDGNFSWLSNVSWQKSDGFLISTGQNNLINQSPNLKTATNTDRQFYSYFANTEYKFGDSDDDKDCETKNAIGLSFIGFGGEKGVSTDPKKNRLWRYDDIARNMAILNGSFLLCGNTVRVSSWIDSYAQTINDFGNDFSFSNISEEQEEKDFTYGSHIIYNMNLGEGETLDISFLAQDISHTNITEDQDFGQYIYSFGGEYTLQFENFSFSAGSSFDITEYYKTGTHTDQAGKQMDDYSLSFGGVYKIMENKTLYANYSRKTRFPTMREQFDKALGKFFVNPNLLPERANTIEIGTDLNFNSLTIKSAIFYSGYEGLIDKQDTILLQEGSIPDTLETRVNLNNAKVAGFEFSALWHAHRRLDVSITSTYLFTEGKYSGKTVNLDYKPEIKLFSFVALKLPHHTEMRAEIDYEGSQWDGKDKLNPSLVLNLRAGHKIIFESTVLDLYLRLNNLLDEARYSKIGIPESGRTFLAGTSFIF
jgi:iron complex outermembrane recepter protein